MQSALSESVKVLTKWSILFKNRDSVPQEVTTLMYSKNCNILANHPTTTYPNTGTFNNLGLWNRNATGGLTGMCRISFKLLPGRTLKMGIVHCVFMVFEHRIFIYFLVLLSLQHCLTLNYNRTKRKVLVLCLAVSWFLGSMARAPETIPLASLLIIQVPWTFRDTWLCGIFPKLEVVFGAHWEPLAQ